MEMKFWIENEFEVEFDYQPEERPIYYPPDNAHPGSDASVEITAIKLFGIPLPEEIKNRIYVYKRTHLVDACHQYAEESLKEKGIRQRGYYKEVGE